MKALVYLCILFVAFSAPAATKQGYSQPYKKHALVAGALGLGCIAFGGVKHMAYLDHKKRADDAYAVYEDSSGGSDFDSVREEVISARDSANDAARLANAGYISGFALAALSGVLYLIRRPDEDENAFQIIPSFNGQGLVLSFRGKF